MRGIPSQEAAPAEATAGIETQESAPAANGKPAEGSATAETKPKSDGNASTSGQSVPPGTLTLTQEELDRRVQAETDRRLAKARQDEAARRKREELAQLRETDPWKYVSEEKRLEAEAAAEAKRQEDAVRLSQAHLEAIDRSVLDPLFDAVPTEARQQILQSMEPGVPGRAKAAERALQAIAAHYTERGVKSARESLAKDPVFVKEILARYGGQRQEPEHVPAVGASPAPFNMNDTIRAMRGR